MRLRAIELKAVDVPRSAEFLERTHAADGQEVVKETLVIGEHYVPRDQLLVNPALYIRSSVLAKMLYVNELYEQIVRVPGVIMEFGVWWGQNLALFESLRAIYEPYNHTRKAVGFDTFTGYPAIGAEDGGSDVCAGGHLAMQVNESQRESQSNSKRRKEQPLAQSNQNRAELGNERIAHPVEPADHPHQEERPQHERHPDAAARPPDVRSPERRDRAHQQAEAQPLLPQDHALPLAGVEVRVDDVLPTECCRRPRKLQHRCQRGWQGKHRRCQWPMQVVRMHRKNEIWNPKRRRHSDHCGL